MSCSINSLSKAHFPSLEQGVANSYQISYQKSLFINTRKIFFDIISHSIVNWKIKITYQKITFKKERVNDIISHIMICWYFYFVSQKIISNHDLTISNHRSFKGWASNRKKISTTVQSSRLFRIELVISSKVRVFFRKELFICSQTLKNESWPIQSSKRHYGPYFIK